MNQLILNATAKLNTQTPYKTNTINNRSTSTEICALENKNNIKTSAKNEFKGETSIMYDKEKGIFPAGTYLVGEDIPIGTYILESRSNLTAGISIYESYSKYKKDDMISYNSFTGDYHLSLRENGIFIDVQNADIKRL